MKKVATILVSLLLTSTFLYNVAGIHLYYAEIKEHNWIKNLENNSNLQYKVLQLNATVYSFMEDTDFEYVNQNITINNKVYHIFKKRVRNNIVSFYYLPNQHQSVFVNKIKQNIDKNNSTNKNDNNSFKTVKDFVPSIAFDLPSHFAIVNVIKPKITTPEMSIPTGYYELPFAPPKFC